MPLAILKIWWRSAQHRYCSRLWDKNLDRRLLNIFSPGLLDRNSLNFYTTWRNHCHLIFWNQNTILQSVSERPQTERNWRRPISQTDLLRSDWPQPQPWRTVSLHSALDSDEMHADEMSDVNVPVGLYFYSLTIMTYHITCTKLTRSWQPNITVPVDRTQLRHDKG